MPSKLFGAKLPDRPHLTRPGPGLSGEINDLRADVEESFNSLETKGGYFRTDEFTDVPAADPNGIKESFSATAEEQTFTLAAGTLDGAVADAGEIVPPRNVTVTTPMDADIDAEDVVITGRVRDISGKLVAQTDTITVTDGGDATDAGTKPFSFVDSVVFPAMSGTVAGVTIGTGALIGLSAKAKSRAGLLAPIREISNGSVVTNGTVTNPTGSPVSAYAPNGAPNGALDYAVTYEVDPS